MSDILEENAQSPLNHAWAVQRPEWWPVYRSDKFINVMSDDSFDPKFPVSVRLHPEDEDLERQLWCVTNCQGRYTVWSEWMGGLPPGDEEGYLFELENDALLFKLTWVGR